MSTTEPHRLPTTVVPSRYHLSLRPDLVGATFAGRVEVAVEITEATDVVVCNAADLEVSSAVVTPAGGSPVSARIELDDKAERLVLRLPDPLPAGAASVAIDFVGTLNDRLQGFYRSTFTDADGVEQVIATTQFESSDARRAFPCWDEPAFKASFAVTLEVPEGLTVLSSGSEVSSESIGDGTRRVRFAETMTMSTYVLAWVVGPFELTDPVEVDGVPVRLASPPGRGHLTPFGLEAAAHALRWLAAYFGLPYPSDKIDHVAIPDFAFGAMENLGCVTYRETALLADLDTASNLELQRVAQVIAHETAHMWFGDLVTMRWWNGIWLNEAFATFMELKTTEALRPDWQVWAAFGAGRAAALGTDGLVHTRPIEIEVGPPEEADAMFDVLTYQKGGSVLRMLEQYLGDEVFRRGISRYLRAHSHANTETGDLWDALEEESGEPVRATMDSWIFQGGHPLVTVERAPDRSTIRLSQQQFRYTPGQAGDEGHWAVPVTLRASVGGQLVARRLLLDGPTDVGFDAPVDWVVVNEGSWGFYRVRYQPELLAALREDLGGRTDPLERAALVGDTAAAVVAGHLDLADWVGLVEALGAEMDPDVWSAVTSMATVLDLTVTDDERHALPGFVRRVASSSYRRLGWEPVDGEHPRAAMARGRVIRLLGTVGADEDVRAEAAARLARWPGDRSALAPDVVNAAIAVVAATGAPGVWDDLLTRYREAPTPQQRIRYLLAFAELPDRDLLIDALDFALSTEVRSQDAPMLIQLATLNRHAGDAAWTWIEDHHDELVRRLPRNLLLRTYDGIVGIVDPALVARVHAFLQGGAVPVGALHIAQLEEEMDIHAAFAVRMRGRVASALGAP